jgi:hypothetical protein
MMSTSPIVALRKAIRAALIADPALSGLLGGAFVFDEAPRGAALPYVAFGDSQTRDWSTATDRGIEQFLPLNIWSQQRGLAEALTIAARVTDLLDDAALALDGWRLVNLRLVASETKREANGRLARASLRFRAAMEQI